MTVASSIGLELNVSDSAEIALPTSSSVGVWAALRRFHTLRSSSLLPITNFLEPTEVDACAAERILCDLL